MEEKLLKTTCGHKFILIRESEGKNYKPHSYYKPAAIYPDGTEEYYLYGLKYEKSVWEILSKIHKKSYESE
jgi:hypothetical protein